MIAGDNSGVCLVVSGTERPRALIAARPRHASSPVHVAGLSGWIRMSHGTEVGLGPGHTVLHGDPASLTERGTSTDCGQSKTRLLACPRRRTVAVVVGRRCLLHAGRDGYRL